jgi:PhnB protein
LAEHGITPYLCVNDGAAAIDFYRRAFGATQLMRLTDANGRIGHADLVVAGAALMLSDEHPEMGVLSPTTLGGSGVALHLVVDDVDALYARAVAEGATGDRSPEDQPHGERMGVLTDPFGHRWFLGTPVETVSTHELRTRYEQSGFATTTDA